MITNMSKSQRYIRFDVPAWTKDYVAGLADTAASSAERMKVAVELSRQNIVHKTGGPFGACVFDLSSGKLVSAGVNLVPTSKFSIAHAEIVAISLAQQKLDLLHLHGYELVSSCEPCAMCTASIPWARVSKLTFGADDEDARTCGFNEGVKPENWREIFKAGGIEVEGPVLREEARAVFDLYNGQIY